jgi:hypothetical protein
MAEVNGQIQVKGDFGNPSGSGIAGIEVYGLPDEAHGTLETRLGAFHAALVTAQLTSTVKCDVGVNYVAPNYVAKPGNSVNVDRKITCTWRLKTATAIRRITIPGLPASSTGVSETDAGERINDTGRTALAGALETLYDSGADTIVVITGVVTQPK